jgi:hypothetical protein
MHHTLSKILHYLSVSTLHLGVGNLSSGFSHMDVWVEMSSLVARECALLVSSQEPTVPNIAYEKTMLQMIVAMQTTEAVVILMVT